jgi:hypothetical protein
MSTLGSSTGLRWPTALCELDVSERLIVWSFRRWASGAEHWPAVRQEFSRQFSLEAAQHALSAFSDFVHTIRGRARRVIHYHQPAARAFAPSRDPMGRPGLIARNEPLARS